LLFAYLGRRNSRFIKNEAGVLPLTGFLCVYPIYDDQEYIDNLWKALNHPETLENLKLVGKSYGSGAIKVEPGNLNKLPIPEHIVAQYNLKRPYKNADGQLEIFREPKTNI
jgi:adenine-specific DNA-methyltransferase